MTTLISTPLMAGATKIFEYNEYTEITNLTYSNLSTVGRYFDFDGSSIQYLRYGYLGMLWDLSSSGISPDKVNNATLTMYAASNAVDGLLNLQIRKVNAPWVTTTSHQNKYSIFDSSPVLIDGLGEGVSSGVWRKLEINITGLVKEWLTTPTLNFGVAFFRQGVTTNDATFPIVSPYEQNQSVSVQTNPSLTIDYVASTDLNIDAGVSSVSTVSADCSLVSPSLIISEGNITSISVVDITASVISPSNQTIDGVFTGTSNINAVVSILLATDLIITANFLANTSFDAIGMVETKSTDISGAITIGGSPIEGAIIYAINEAGTKIYKAFSDVNGNYSIRVEGIGTYHIFSVYQNAIGLFSAKVQPFLTV